MNSTQQFIESEVRPMGSGFKNQEGYADPTAGQAIAQVVKEEKKYRPLVYICSPFSSDPVGNTEKAKRYSRYAVDAGAIPFAPHLLLPLYMKEESERGLALFMDMVFLSKCDELWVFGDKISSGMQAEIDKATRKNMKIRYFTDACCEKNTEQED